MVAPRYNCTCKLCHEHPHSTMMALHLNNYTSTALHCKSLGLSSVGRLSSLLTDILCIASMMLSTAPVGLMRSDLAHWLKLGSSVGNTCCWLAEACSGLRFSNAGYCCCCSSGLSPYVGINLVAKYRTSGESCTYIDKPHMGTQLYMRIKDFYSI